MSTAAIPELHQEGLTLLFERGLELALRLQEDAMAAESAEGRARLANAFHRISRSVRQTAALQAKLQREARLDGREDRRHARDEDKQGRNDRRQQVTATIQRIIWTEAANDEEAGSLSANLELFLDEDAVADDFLTEPLEAQIARICGELELPPPGKTSATAASNDATLPSAAAGEGVGPGLDPGATDQRSPSGPMASAERCGDAEERLVPSAETVPLVPQGETASSATRAFTDAPLAPWAGSG